MLGIFSIDLDAAFDENSFSKIAKALRLRENTRYPSLAPKICPSELPLKARNYSGHEGSSRRTTGLQ